MMPLLELLDIGGEGRYADAWNLNPNEMKTLGPQKGMPIPRRIAGRAEAIPLLDRSVGSIIMERTPLRQCAIAEFLRVIQQGGTIVLRHHVSDRHDPHVWAHRLIPVAAEIRRMKLGNQEVQESKYDLGRYHFTALQETVQDRRHAGQIPKFPYARSSLTGRLCISTL